MNEIDKNALAAYVVGDDSGGHWPQPKIGKRVGRGAKVKNATKISHDGIEFDSKLEYNCYMILKDSGIKFEFKPEKLVLVPKFKTMALQHTIENEKLLRSKVREAAPDKAYMEKLPSSSTKKLYQAECKRDQSRIKRIFNIDHKKVLREKSILPVTWAPDFYLIDYDMYVEAKGFANETFPIKFKMARYQLGIETGVSDVDVVINSESAIEVGSKKEMNDLINYLKQQKQWI